MNDEEFDQDAARQRRSIRAERASDTRFENKVDPDQSRSMTERLRLAGNARKAHMQRMSIESAKSRQSEDDLRHPCPVCRAEPGDPCRTRGEVRPKAHARRNPKRREQIARLAAHERWMRTGEADRKAQARRAQRGLQDRWERQVDPDGVLPEAERIKLAENAKKAHMTRMSMKAPKPKGRRK